MAEVSSEKYKVLSVENTIKDGYSDPEYHSKYIGQEGLMIRHPHRSANYADYICLYFLDMNEADWFHKNDLERLPDVEVEITVGR